MSRPATARILKPKIAKIKKRTPAVRQGKPFTMDDPLWTIVGLGKSGDPADVSENKDQHLADAYDPKRAWSFLHRYSLAAFSLIPQSTMP